MSNIIDSIQLSGVTYTIQGSGGNPTVELTQAEYDALVTAGTVSPTTYYIITDAQAGDLTQYWTSAQTQSAITQATSGKVDTSTYNTYTAATDTALANKADTATTYTKTEVDTALASKQTTLTAGTGIDITDNVISATGGGGGKAIEAGRGISITTGETADTVSFNLPISAGTGSNSIIIGLYDSSRTSTGKGSYSEGFARTSSGDYSHAEGSNTYATANYAHAEGYYGRAKGEQSHAEGYDTNASGKTSHAEGTGTQTRNESEHASGHFNLSVSASTTFGDSGNTLFSVGNGTSNNARHNAFEIRQNGDIYLSSGGTDIKLQDYLGGGGSITIDPSLDSGSTNAVANSAITEAVNSKVNISDNNVSAFSGVQLAIAENTYYGDKDVRTIYIKSIGNTQYTDKLLCIVRFGNSNSSMSFTLTGSTSGSYSSGGTITAYTINSSYVTHSLSNGVITVTFNDTSYHLLSVENVVKNIGIYYTKGGYSSGQTADVVENTVYDVLTELGENLVNNNNNNNFVTLDTAQDITGQKNFIGDKGIKFSQKTSSNKPGFVIYAVDTANTTTEAATFEFRPNTFTETISGTTIKHPLLYFGHYRTTTMANKGIPQTVVGFRQYDQPNAAAYHYLIPLPEKAKTPFSLTTSFKDYYAPMGFKNGSTMITADNTGVVDLSSELGGLKLVKLTQAEYDALATKDNSTLYVIVN